MKLNYKKIFALLNSEKRVNSVCAIICAAGNAQRMGLPDGKSKLFLELGGVSILETTINKFLSSSFVNAIIISARPDDFPPINDIISKLAPQKKVLIVEGGNTRQNSVFRAFEAMGKDYNFVAIHDGARCGVSVTDIDAVIQAAFKSGAAVASTAVTDTVKSVDDNGIILKTINRDSLRCVQTPQVFMREIYLVGMTLASREKSNFTDDSGIVQNAGFKVTAVECSKSNIKITTHEDYLIAKKLF